MGVCVVGPRGLVDLIATSAVVLNADEVARLTGIAEQRLRPAAAAG